MHAQKYLAEFKSFRKKKKRKEEGAEWRQSTDAGELMVQVQELCLRDKVIEDQNEDVKAWRNLSPAD